MAYKGKYKPKNINKYKGNPTNVIYRSLWERQVMITLDKDPRILQWNAEGVIIPYISPIDGKAHRYFVDFWVMKEMTEGKSEEFLIEVKPMKQTAPPNPKNKNNTPTGRLSRRYLNETKTFGINMAKWKAADAFAAKRNMKFIVLTEKGVTERWRNFYEIL